MNKALDIGLIAITNFIGYWSVALCFIILLQLGIITEDYFANNDKLSFQDWSVGILLVWLGCMLFSIAGLFVKKNDRYILFVAPAIVPAIYGLSVIFLFGGVSS